MAKIKHTAMRAINVYQWHPMSRYPRNAQCPCQSGNKFKHCCSKKFVAATVKNDNYAKIRNFVNAARKLHAVGQLNKTINEGGKIAD